MLFQDDSWEVQREGDNTSEEPRKRSGNKNKRDEKGSLEEN